MKQIYIKKCVKCGAEIERDNDREYNVCYLCKKYRQLITKKQKKFSTSLQQQQGSDIVK